MPARLVGLNKEPVRKYGIDSEGPDAAWFEFELLIDGVTKEFVDAASTYKEINNVYLPRFCHVSSTGEKATISVNSMAERIQEAIDEIKVHINGINEIVEKRKAGQKIVSKSEARQAEIDAQLNDALKRLKF